jgi:choline dehydrogenase-like flavoprotein
MESPFSASAGLIYVLQKPFSRGSINLNTTDIYSEPIVDFQVLTHPIDLKLLIEMFRFTRKWIAASPNQELGAVEGAVTANLTTDEEIGRFLTTSVTPSIAHPAGTNAMMPPELGGVVSDELLVHGLSGLSIVDASIIPLIPSTHLCATVYAIAEKAADLIKARASLL